MLLQLNCPAKIFYHAVGRGVALAYGGSDLVGPAGAISGGEAKLVIIANDASERTRENFEFFAEEAGVSVITVAQSAEELGNAIGKRPCAVIAICDVGFSAAIVKKLEGINDSAKAVSEKLILKAERANSRKKQRRTK